MQEFKIIFMPRALSDLEKIHAYIAHDSHDNAARLVTRILDAIELLKTAPHRTVFAPGSRLPHPVRVLPVSNYLVYFRVLDDVQAVRILHIRHGAQRRPRRIE